MEKEKKAPQETTPAQAGQKEETIIEEKPPSDKYLIIALAVIVACVAVFLLVQHFYKPAQKYEIVKYNGFQFVNMADLWYFNWQKDNQTYIVSFNYNPKQVEAIPVYGQIDGRFKQQQIYLTHDPTEEGQQNAAMAVAVVELASMQSTLNLQLQAACTANTTEACWDRPIINCENTNSSVIYLKEGNETRIDLLGNCMVIQGEGTEIIKATEKVLYIWYKVIQ